MILKSFKLLKLQIYILLSTRCTYGNHYEDQSTHIDEPSVNIDSNIL